MKHSAQAFRIPQTLSEQSSKNFGIWQSKRIVPLRPGYAAVEQQRSDNAGRARPPIGDREKGTVRAHGLKGVI